MKLSAVTISVGYASYLERTLAGNRRHFDRLVVVTSPDDAETLAFCAREGLEAVLVEGPFHAAWGKWRHVNAGLEALGVEGWVVVMDADLLLPCHFRERLEAQELEPGFLHGLSGRRIVESRAAFEVLAGCEPWEAEVVRPRSVLGYFNLFHAATLPNRYAERLPGEGTGDASPLGHDDGRFYAMFGRSRSRVLPFTGLHLGQKAVNWAGAVARTEGGVDSARGDGKPREWIPPGATVLVVGAWPGGEWEAELAGAARVFLMRQDLKREPEREFPEPFLTSGWPDPEMEVRDRRWWERAIFSGKDGSTRVMADAAALGQMAPGTLDAVFLAGDPGMDWLAGEGLALAERLLKAGGRVGGSVFGVGAAPELTATLLMMWGWPEVAEASGWWMEWPGAGRVPALKGGFTKVPAEYFYVRHGAANRLAATLAGEAPERWGATVVVAEGGGGLDVTVVCAAWGLPLISMNRWQRTGLGQGKTWWWQLDEAAARERAGEILGLVEARALEIEAESFDYLVIPVLVRKGTTVVFFVREETFEEFARLQAAVEFPPSTPVLVVAVGLQGELRAELMMGELPEGWKIAEAWPGEGADWRAAAFKVVAREAQTRFWVELDPGFVPVPGAELFVNAVAELPAAGSPALVENDTRVQVPEGRGVPVARSGPACWPQRR